MNDVFNCLIGDANELCRVVQISVGLKFMPVTKNICYALKKIKNIVWLNHPSTLYETLWLLVVSKCCYSSYFGVFIGLFCSKLVLP